MKLKVFEAFAGYGSQSMALERLKQNCPEFDYEVVGFAEVDPYAIKAYRAVHGEGIPNLGDVTKIDWGGVRQGCGFVHLLFPLSRHQHGWETARVCTGHRVEVVAPLGMREGYQRQAS